MTAATSPSSSLRVWVTLSIHKVHTNIASMSNIACTRSSDLSLRLKLSRSRSLRLNVGDVFQWICVKDIIEYNS